MARFEFIKILFLCLVFQSCENEIPQVHNLVIEGWIEEGKEPIVMLHYAYSLENPTMSDTSELADVAANQLERYARVAILDGENEYVLYGQLNNKFLPPYIYSTTHFVGEAGKCYKITASRNDISVTATTFIPQEKPTVDSIRVSNVGDSIQAVLAYVNVPKSEKVVYYNAFLRQEGEFQFRSFLMSHFQSSQAKNGQIELPVYSIQSVGNFLSAVGNHFLQTDTAQYFLHLALVDEISYRIWEGISAQSVNQGMYFMSIYKNMPSNVSSGFGYWCGYNSAEFSFKVNCDTTFVY